MSYQTIQTSSTTTKRPDGGSADRPAGIPGGGRPPASYSEEEIFLDGKCGKLDTRNMFLESCINPSTEVVKGIKCNGLRGSSGICDLDLRYTFDSASDGSRDGAIGDGGGGGDGVVTPIDDSILNTTTTTATTTITSIPSKTRGIPTGFHYEYNCGFGPGKPLTTWRGDVVVPRDKMESVIKFCRQELYGVPGLPLWLIILIIFLVIAAVSITAALFWKYWLRNKLYGKDQGDNSIGSYYTSAPFSSNNSSALPSSGGPGSNTKKISRRNSGSGGGSGSAGGISKQVAPSANRSSNYGPYKLLSSHKVESVTGKAPSVRSLISRSLSGRTPSGRPP